MTQKELDLQIEKLTRSRKIHGAVFLVHDLTTSEERISASGNLSLGSRYYIASINKFMLASMVLRHVHRGEIALNDRLVACCSGLPVAFHCYKGEAFSHRITLRHLLSHTSGLPCYLLDKKPDSSRSMKQMLKGDDQAWPLERVFETVSKMGGLFVPGQPGKAHYSETNYRLLAHWLEQLTGRPIREQLESLCSELEMSDTIVLPNGEIPTAPVYSGINTLSLTNYWSSTGDDIASTARDQMKFLRAVHSGHFYPIAWLEREDTWNRIFFPFRYSLGRQKFSVPRILSPFQSVPEMVGHSGSCGSVAFAIPSRSLLITGTVNQAAKPSAAFQAMVKIAAS